MRIEDVQLPPLEELLVLAEVTDKSLQGAIAEWDKNPPLPDTETLLEAEDDAE